ncbi:MAG: DUF262 domain-containing protein [candidate division WOR-3 bacterium]
MKLKDQPRVSPVPISTFIIHKKRYRVDPTYQREKGIWTKPDEQYLIDTILRWFAMPPVFLHRRKGKEFIVDGQQRLNTIWKFKDDKLELNDKYSSDIINDDKNKERNNGRPAYKYSELHSEWQNRFDAYPIPTIYLEDYNDEEVRDLFRRLQHGKPLIPGEILNAYPGKIVVTMRELAKNKFFTNIIRMGAKRYKYYFLIAQLMFLESEGIRDISPSYIYNFFEKNADIDQNTKVYTNISKTLNYLFDCFQSKTPELSKPGWIITLFLLASHLLENYSMNNQKNNLKNFFIDFYQKVINSSTIGDKELIDFNLAISKGTTSQANIKRRYEIIRKRFLADYNPMKLDENRLFNKNQKIAIFRRDQEKCQICGEKLTFGNSKTHYHHKDKYIEGGRTEIENGLLVCKNCHLCKIHGKSES